MCVFFYFLFFLRTCLSCFRCNGGVKNLVLRLISAIGLSLSLWFSFVLALNFSVILNVQVLPSVCT